MGNELFLITDKEINIKMIFIFYVLCCENLVVFTNRRPYLQQLETGTHSNILYIIYKYQKCSLQSYCKPTMYNIIYILMFTYISYYYYAFILIYKYQILEYYDNQSAQLVYQQLIFTSFLHLRTKSPQLVINII